MGKGYFSTFSHRLSTISKTISSTMYHSTRNERVVPGAVRRLDVRGGAPIELTVVAGTVDVLGAVVVRSEA